MNMGSQGASTTAADAKVIPQKLKKLTGNWINWYIPAISVCVAVGFAVISLATFISLFKLPTTTIQINATGKSSADSKGSQIVFRGAMVDGTWVNPEDLVSESDWQYNSNIRQYSWHSGIQNQKITVYLPVGKKRMIVFSSGPNQGIAEIEVEGNKKEYNFYAEELSENGKGVEIPAFSGGVYPIGIFVCMPIIVFLCAFVGSYLFLHHKYKMKIERGFSSMHFPSWNTVFFVGGGVACVCAIVYSCFPQSVVYAVLAFTVSALWFGIVNNWLVSE